VVWDGACAPGFESLALEIIPLKPPEEGARESLFLFQHDVFHAADCWSVV
jgi:hypothetical protein